MKDKFINVLLVAIGISLVILAVKPMEINVIGHINTKESII